MEKIKLLSLIVPAYKQEKTIVKDITNLDKVLFSLPFKYEIIVVVDGFLDKTYDALRNLASEITNLKVLFYEKNHGKGYAVRYGMSKATGDVIGFIDAGMDIEANGIGILLDYMLLHDADIVIGSKLHPDSVVKYPTQRKILSWGYRAITQTLFGFGVRDTQVGLKLFKKKVAKEVFPLLAVKKFAFDVEILAVSYARGYRKIYEAPVKLTYDWGSSIANFTSGSFWNVIFSMLWDTAAVFYRLKILHYYDKKNVKK
jgi:glycosyltransferase involved in cell wall biosynthesis